MKAIVADGNSKVLWLNLANACEVLVELAAVGGAKCALELPGLPGDEIEDALAPAVSLGGVNSARAAEKAVENETRIDLLGDRRLLALPR